MTDEERQRQMDFIVNTLASVSAKLYTLVERVDGLAAVQAQAELERKADAVRISRIEEAFVALYKLSERIYERLDEHQSRIVNVEDAIVILKGLLDRMSNRTAES
ncbi:MAG TPA: hypothetical protein VGC91_08410 [Pyrinomonadaceae bacterium]|jgi:hypothetical protein